MPPSEDYYDQDHWESVKRRRVHRIAAQEDARLVRERIQSEGFARRATPAELLNEIIGYLGASRHTPDQIDRENIAEALKLCHLLSKTLNP